MKAGLAHFNFWIRPNSYVRSFVNAREPARQAYTPTD